MKSKQMVFEDPVVRPIVALIDHMGDDRSVVNAARVSYGEGTKHFRPDSDLIKYLMANGHMSPFEFVEFVFYVKAPIFVARQWFRHRTGSYAEKSGRYSVMGESYYAPTDVRRKVEKSPTDMADHVEEAEETLELLHAMRQSITNSDQTYRELLDAGVVREQARAVLPMATMTEFYYKTNLRNLFNFLLQRMDAHAQIEIRAYAAKIYQIVRDIVPISMAAFDEYVRTSITLTASELDALVFALGEEEAKSAIANVVKSQSRLKKLWAEISGGIA